MASVILRGILGKSRHLTGISKLQARCVSPSSSLSSVSKDDKEILLPEEIKRKRVEEFMANFDKNPLYQERKAQIEDYLEQWKYENVRLPDTIKDEHWYILLTENFSYMRALNYMFFLTKVESAEMRDKRKREEKKLQREEQKKVHYEEYPEFSLHIPNRDKEQQKWNRIQAFQSDIPVVIDMHFPDCNAREQKAAAQQVFMAMGNNIKHRQPLQIHVTSICDNRAIMDYSEAQTNIPLICHEEHFMDLFPPEQLLYLSPDGPPLRNFNPNMIYIIGGLVDRAGRPRLTYSNAKRLGIKCASLPLKNNVALETRKAFNIDLVFDLVQNMHLYHSWQDAFDISFISKKHKVKGRTYRKWDITSLRRR